MMNGRIVLLCSVCVIPGCGLLPPNNVEQVHPDVLGGKGELLSMPAQLRTIVIHNVNKVQAPSSSHDQAHNVNKVQAPSSGHGQAQNTKNGQSRNGSNGKAQNGTGNTDHSSDESQDGNENKEPKNRDSQDKDAFVTCAEPMPDVALSDTFKMITGVTVDTSVSKSNGNGESSNGGNKNSINNDLQTSATALELAGRTQIVLLARELLFRTCEAAANGWLNGDGVEKQQTEIIKAITVLVDSDKKKADAAKANADAAVINANAVMAKINLDRKIVDAGEGAVRYAVTKGCLKQFYNCLGQARNDKNAISSCRSTVMACLLK